MATEDLQAISTPAEDTRREQLSALLDAAPEGPVSETPVAEASAPEATPEPEGPARDENGKFVAAEAPAPAQAAEETPPAVVAEEPVWKRPPASWGKMDHEKWIAAAGNPETAPFVQKAWEREEEMRRGVEPLIPKAKFADQVNEAMAPFQENIRASGVEPVQALQSLMVADHQLRSLPMEQKAAYGLSLLTQYGVPLDAIYAALANPPPQIPPGYVPQQQIQGIVQNQLTSWQEQQEAQVLQAEIEEFKKDKPDFEALKPYMQSLLEKNLVPDLATAYEKAKRLDDTSYAGLQAAHQANAETERRAAADKAAKAAKAAAVSARSSSPGATPPTKAQDRRSLISAQLDESENRF